MVGSYHYIKNYSAGKPASQPIQAEPAVPAVSRKEQLERKADPPARGRGRGKGAGRGGRGGGKGEKAKDTNKSKKDEQVYDDPHDPNWHWSESTGWYYYEEEPTASRKKRNAGSKDDKDDKEKPKRAKTRSAASAASAPVEEVPDKSAKRKRKGEPTEAEADKKPKKEHPPKDGKRSKEAKEAKVVKDVKVKRSKKGELDPPPLPAPKTEKEVKQEILEFLVACKDLTDENAKDEIKHMMPNNYGAFGYECSLNIYWARRGVKGVGCGVKSKVEQCDVSFFGFKCMCESWIFAIAAATKAADIYVAWMHIKQIWIIVNLYMHEIQNWTKSKLYKFLSFLICSILLLLMCIQFSNLNLDYWIEFPSDCRL